MAFQRNAFQKNAFQVGYSGIFPPPPVSGGLGNALPIGFGTQGGRRHGVAGQRTDDIKIEKRVFSALDKLRIQEIDNHDIMFFVKTFRQFNQ